MGTYQTFSVGGLRTGGMMDNPTAMSLPSWNYVYSVSALDGAVARTQAGGWKVLHGPVQVPGDLWIAKCLDQQGVAFGLASPGR
jgi:predicted enzyme related to lactoylglutathione lyase